MDNLMATLIADLFGLLPALPDDYSVELVLRDATGAALGTTTVPAADINAALTALNALAA